jgi:LmbE family N-acetylglucosaminyl deacetylase
MEETSPTELRGQLVYLFRRLKVDTLITFDPADIFEGNPDHPITGREAFAAHWISGGRLDYPEQLLDGCEPRGVPEIYFFNRYVPQLVNRAVDVSTTIETKIAAIRANRTQVAHMALRLKDRLAAQNKRLPVLGDDVDTAIQGYAEFFRAMTAEAGKPYGLAYAELFRYWGPRTKKKSLIQSYVEAHALPIR